MASTYHLPLLKYDDDHGHETNVDVSSAAAVVSTDDTPEHSTAGSMHGAQLPQHMHEHAHPEKQQQSKQPLQKPHVQHMHKQQAQDQPQQQKRLPPQQSAQAKLEELSRLRRRRVFICMLRLLEKGAQDAGQLTRLTESLTGEEFLQVAEERALAGKCGNPLCPKPHSSPDRGPAYRRVAGEVRRSGPDHFCSFACSAFADQVAKSLGNVAVERLAPQHMEQAAAAGPSHRPKPGEVAARGRGVPTMLAEVQEREGGGGGAAAGPGVRVGAEGSVEGHVPRTLLKQQQEQQQRQEREQQEKQQQEGQQQQLERKQQQDPMQQQPQQQQLLDQQVEEQVLQAPGQQAEHGAPSSSKAATGPSTSATQPPSSAGGSASSTVDKGKKRSVRFGGAVEFREGQGGCAPERPVLCFTVEGPAAAEGRPDGRTGDPEELGTRFGSLRVADALELEGAEVAASAAAVGEAPSALGAAAMGASVSETATAVGREKRGDGDGSSGESSNAAGGAQAVPPEGMQEALKLWFPPAAGGLGVPVKSVGQQQQAPKAAGSTLREPGGTAVSSGAASSSGSGAQAGAAAGAGASVLHVRPTTSNRVLAALERTPRPASFSVEGAAAGISTSDGQQQQHAASQQQQQQARPALRFKPTIRPRRKVVLLDAPPDAQMTRQRGSGMAAGARRPDAAAAAGTGAAAAAAPAAAAQAAGSAPGDAGGDGSAGMPASTVAPIRGLAPGASTNASTSASASASSDNTPLAAPLDPEKVNCRAAARAPQAAAGARDADASDSESEDWSDHSSDHPEEEWYYDDDGNTVQVPIREQTSRSQLQQRQQQQRHLQQHRQHAAGAANGVSGGWQEAVEDGDEEDSTATSEDSDAGSGRGDEEEEEEDAEEEGQELRDDLDSDGDYGLGAAVPFFGAPRNGVRAELPEFGALWSLLNQLVTDATRAHLHTPGGAAAATRASGGGPEGGPGSGSGGGGGGGGRGEAHAPVPSLATVQATLALSELLGQALPAVMAALRIKVPASEVSKQLSALVRTFSLAHPLPGLQQRQWQVVVALLLAALSWRRLEGLRQVFNRGHPSQLLLGMLEERGQDKERFFALLELLHEEEL